MQQVASASHMQRVQRQYVEMRHTFPTVSYKNRTGFHLHIAFSFYTLYLLTAPVSSGPWSICSMCNPTSPISDLLKMSLWYGGAANNSKGRGHNRDRVRGHNWVRIRGYNRSTTRKIIFKHALEKGYVGSQEGTSHWKKKQEHPAKNTNPCQTGVPSLKLTVHRFTPEYMIGRIPKGKEMNHQGAVNSLVFFRFREDVTTNPCQWSASLGSLWAWNISNGQWTSHLTQWKLRKSLFEISRDRYLGFACLVLGKNHKHMPQVVVKNGDYHGRK